MPAPADAATASPRRERRAVALLSVAAFASAASGRVCDAMLPQLADRFGTDLAVASWTVAAYTLAYGLVQPFIGTIGDRIGKYRLVAWCTIASLVGTLASAAAISLDTLVVARLVTGLTAGGIIPLAMAWIGDVVPYDRRQETLAFFLVGQILGMVSGQFFGGLFTAWLGWRETFLILALCHAPIGLAVLRGARTAPRAEAAGPAAANDGLIARLFVVVRRPWARVVLVTVTLEAMATFGPLALIPTHMHRLGVSPSVSGVSIFGFGLGGLLCILSARPLLRRLREPGMALVGGGLLAISWGAIAATDLWWTILPAMGAAGFGYYQFHTTLQTHATQMAPEARGTAVSLFSAAFFMGQSLGVFACARLIDSAGFTLVFGGFALCAIVTAAVFTVLVGRHARASRLRPPSGL